MEVVLDSNVLFRTLISRGPILKLMFNENLVIFAPLQLKLEFINHKAELISKSNLSEKTFNEFCALLFEKITFMPLDEYKKFLHKAKQVLAGHEKDE